MKTKFFENVFLFAGMILSLVPTISVMALNGTAEYAPVESNIALKSWVNATVSSNSGNAALAVDGKDNTVWMADTGGSPHWFMVDLGGAYDAVRRTEVIFADNNTAYQYKLEGSVDGTNWFTLADRTDNSRRAAGFTDIFVRKGLRFLKLTFTSDKNIGIREFKVINYLRDDMLNGSDMSELGSNLAATNNTAYFYNAGNNPSTQYRGGMLRTSDPKAGNNIFGLVKDLGWSVNRLRIWNEPKGENNGTPNDAVSNCSPENTLKMASYVTGSGLDLAIDFHYSDSWSDPQNQPKPYAWAELSFDDLVQATYDFTYKTIRDLVAQGTPPAIVAIGNEITNGMMWGKEYDDLGEGVDHHHYYASGRHLHEWGGGIIWKYWHQDRVTPEQYRQYLESFRRLALLVDAGIKGVRKVEKEMNVVIETEVHCAFNLVEGSARIPVPDEDKLPKVKEFIIQLTSRLDETGSTIDRIGISYYEDWHGSFAELERNAYEISKLVPGVKINISECSPRMQGTASDRNNNYPPGFVFTPQTQGDEFARLFSIMCDLPDNVGQGVWTWRGTGVNFASSGTDSDREPHASIKVYKDAFATNVLENGLYVTTEAGNRPILPATVKNIDLATGVTSDVPVAWDNIPASSYTATGTITVIGVAQTNGNIKAVTANITVAEI